MAATDWITAIATLVLAVMAVITLNGTYKILPSHIYLPGCGKGKQ